MPTVDIPAPVPQEQDRAARPGGRRATWRGASFVRDYGALLGMLAVLGVFGILEPAVLVPANLGNVLQQSASLAIMASGFAVAMMVRGVDLSVAQTSDAAGLLAAYFLVQGQPLWMVFVLPLVFGLLVGVVNGALIAYLGVPALIGTLGMMFVVRSFELVALLTAARRRSCSLSTRPAPSCSSSSGRERSVRSASPSYWPSSPWRFFTSR